MSNNLQQVLKLKQQQVDISREILRLLEEDIISLVITDIKLKLAEISNVDEYKKLFTNLQIIFPVTYTDEKIKELLENVKQIHSPLSINRKIYENQPATTANTAAIKQQQQQQPIIKQKSKSTVLSSNTVEVRSDDDDVDDDNKSSITSISSNSSSSSSSSSSSGSSSSNSTKTRNSYNDDDDKPTKKRSSSVVKKEQKGKLSKTNNNNTPPTSSKKQKIVKCDSADHCPFYDKKTKTCGGIICECLHCSKLVHSRCLPCFNGEGYLLMTSIGADTQKKIINELRSYKSFNDIPDDSFAGKLKHNTFSHMRKHKCTGSDNSIGSSISTSNNNKPNLMDLANAAATQPQPQPQTQTLPVPLPVPQHIQNGGTSGGTAGVIVVA